MRLSHKILVAMLVTFMSTICIAGDVPTIYQLTDKTRTNATLRSLVLPGSGQFFLGRNTEGYIASMGASIGLLGGIYSYYKADASYSDYQKRGMRNDSSYNDYVMYTNYMYYSLGVCVVAWIYGVIDAYYGGGDISGNKKSLMISADPNNVISYSVEF